MPRSTTDPLAGEARAGWLDAARGVGIVLVVLGHALRGIESSPAELDPGLFAGSLRGRDVGRLETLLPPHYFRWGVQARPLSASRPDNAWGSPTNLPLSRLRVGFFQRFATCKAAYH